MGMPCLTVTPPQHIPTYPTYPHITAGRHTSRPVDSRGSPRWSGREESGTSQEGPWGIISPAQKMCPPGTLSPGLRGGPWGSTSPSAKRPPPSLKGGRLLEVPLGKEGLAQESLYPPGFFALRCLFCVQLYVYSPVGKLT